MQQSNNISSVEKIHIITLKWMIIKPKKKCSKPIVIQNDKLSCFPTFIRVIFLKKKAADINAPSLVKNLSSFVWNAVDERTAGRAG